MALLQTKRRSENERLFVSVSNLDVTLVLVDGGCYHQYMITKSISLQPLEEGDDELIKQARDAVLPLVEQRFEGERITSVGAAARWQDNRVFAGANVRHPSSPASCICGELVALSNAYNTTHSRDLDVIVAYWYENDD